MKKLLSKIPLFPYNSRYKTSWDIFMIVAIFYSALSIPYRMVAGQDYTDFFYWLISIVFFLDILVNLRTTVKIRLNVISSRKEIIRRYFRTWFIPDLLAAFPFSAVMVLVSGSDIKGSLIFNIFLALRLLRLLKLIKITVILRTLQETITVNPTIMRLITFSFWFALMLHFISLGWITIGAGDQTGTFELRYLRAFYWCLTTVATIGYGDITPDRNSQLQMIYTIIAQLIGVGMFGYIIGNITSLIANIDVAKAEFVKKMEEIKEYMHLKKLPYELQEKVKNYYNYIWITQKSVNKISFLSELPHTLNTEISLFLNKTILEKVSLFKDADEIFIREVIRLLEPVVFLPQDFIIRQGEYGDCMYFINSGEVEVIVNDNVVAKLNPGSFFGETALIQGENRNASIRTTTYCDTYKLSKDSFDNLRHKYEKFDLRINEIMKARLHDSQNKSGK
ncbi:MAG: ion transporter [bacterium]|nr:ion transporter [bacterium]